MKVVFYFMSEKSKLIDSDNWKTDTCGKQYEKHYPECYFMMFQKLLDSGVITDLTVFYESAKNPGKAEFVKGAKNFVVPHISMTDEFIDENTIIFVRGGFKHWHDWLLQYKGKNWLICYAANTGRDKWLLWDIIFDDLEMKNIVDRRQRYFFPFIKPTNEEIFYPEKQEIKYDVCIGASHIHDKKGQWQAVEVMEQFYTKFGYYPRMVMPGAVRGSTETNKMLKKQIMNEIEMPGMLSKKELAVIFNQSKLYMGIGAGGQNDRGILEAAACGCTVIYSAMHRHTPLLKRLYSYYWPECKSLLNCLRDQLEDSAPLSYREFKHSLFLYNMGFDPVVIPMLSELFNNLAKEPTFENKTKLVPLFEKYISKEG